MPGFAERVRQIIMPVTPLPTFVAFRGRAVCARLEPTWQAAMSVQRRAPTVQLIRGAGSFPTLSATMVVSCITHRFSSA
jgi:hypothetical protein